MSTIHYSAIPPVHEGPVEFMALVRPPAPLPSHFLPGTIDVAWIRSATYTIVLEHLGVEVATLATYCDVGELLGTLEEAIAAAASRAKHYKITADTTLAARLLVDVDDSPFMPAEDDEPERRVRRWRGLQDGLYHRADDLGADWLAGDVEHRIEHPLARIEARKVLARREVWSSHTSPQVQDRQRDQLRRLASERFSLSGHSTRSARRSPAAG